MDDPSRVVVEGETGRTFINTVSDKDSERVGDYKFTYIISVIFGIILGLLILFLAATGELDAIVFGASGMAFCLTFLLVLVIYLVIRWQNKRGSKKKDKAWEIISYCKVFPSVLFLHQKASIFLDRTNVVLMKDIDKVDLDVPGLFIKEGIRLPFSYWPFRRMSPNKPRKGTNLYFGETPLDHLVRIKFRRPVKIKTYDTSKKVVWVREDAVSELDDIIIQIRPEEKAEFLDLVNRYAAAKS